MKNPLIEHAEEHNLFGDNQHGFRGSRSTTSNILIHNKRILKQLEEGKSVDTNYVDLSKAFDKVGHAKLIRKLKKAGYHRRLLHFFYNFLRNRTQRVLANGELSEPLPVTGGTPQGAALSPFFFSILLQTSAI